MKYSAKDKVEIYSKTPCPYWEGTANARGVEMARSKSAIGRIVERGSAPVIS